MSNSRNRTLCAASLVGMLLIASAAGAAGPFDGTWIGKDETGPCAGYAATITVVNSNASGAVTGPYGTDYIRDKFIHSNGTATYYTGHRKPIHLKFSAGTFEISEAAECGSVSITGTKQ